jgi:hypothetical protein
MIDRSEIMITIYVPVPISSSLEDCVSSVLEPSVGARLRDDESAPRAARPDRGIS